MDLRTAEENIRIAKMLISQWARKYGIGESEHILVMEKLDEAASELAAAAGEGEPEIRVVGKTATLPQEKPVALHQGKPAVSHRPLPEEGEDELPTLSEIEREIIMHETGEPPEGSFEALSDKARSDREALKSLYYEDTAKETAAADAGEYREKTLGDIAHQINDTETFNDRFADELLVEERRSKPVLGEILARDTHTVGDSFASHENGVVAGMNGKEGLRKAIGLNDKYLLVRDLFRGDEALYEQTIEALEGFGDLDDAMLYIHDNFQWDPQSEGVKLLVELLVNKLT